MVRANDRRPRLNASVVGELANPAANANRGPKASKVCEVTQTRFSDGLMLVKKRRIRAPLVGRVGNESKCSKSLRACSRAGRAFSSIGR